MHDVRIRSIRPEFWSSTDIAALPWETRLIFIGIWSYVDDNGVGRDVEKLIQSDLFPLEDDTHGALMQVAGALKQLETGGQITRYSVDGKPYLHVTSWDKHQLINRPSKGRYPLPTCTNAEIRHDSVSPHVKDMSPHADYPVGEGEKGRRGEGEKTSADASSERFEEFYAAYPRKEGKGQAAKAWRVAVKKAEPDLVMAGLKRRLPSWDATEKRFIPLPASWLNGERWDDEIVHTSEPTRAARNPNIPEGWL